MSDMINAKSLPTVVALTTYVDDSISEGDYSRATMMTLIDNVDIVDVLAAQALLISALMQEVEELDPERTASARLQHYGRTAESMAHAG